ncbi:serine/threonine protein kinase, partial [Actinospica durhamensis]
MAGRGSPDGTVAGRYRISAELGRGGMGRVWRAYDPMLDRDVALKEIVLPSGMSADERGRALLRIRREARAAARLNHAGIVRVHDIVEHAGSPMIVMEYLDGRSLREVIDMQGPLPLDRAVALGAAVLAALRHAHAAGVVHRDLKPDNIMVTADGRIVLTDFGIARVLGEHTPVTVPGTIIGTPAFMAPELIEGKAPTPAADLWSLGATLYAAVEGHPPFEGGSITELCLAILLHQAPPARNARELTAVLDGLMVKDPAQRATAAWTEDRLAHLAHRAAETTVTESSRPG